LAPHAVDRSASTRAIYEFATQTLTDAKEFGG